MGKNLPQNLPSDKTFRKPNLIIVIRKPSGQLAAISPFYDCWCVEKHEGQERPLSERIADLVARVELRLSEYHNEGIIVEIHGGAK